MTLIPEQLWHRIIEAFSRAAIPQVTVAELAVVLALATALSIPRATWKYFGLLATATHELGHAFAAVMSGQRLGGIRLRLDHSGTTTSYSRGRAAAVWSGFWGYPVPALTGAALVTSGFAGWGPAALATGTLILLASLVFIRNAAGLLITGLAVAGGGVLVLVVPSNFTGHIAIVLGLALLVAAVRDLAKLTNVHLRRRDRLSSSDAYLLYRATSIPSGIWIALFVAVIAGSWLVAWQPISAILASGA
ncbi:M50 family peptidase [Pseudarthrobacter psychrotolerans]|uniref:M50 family peptidase n=1 Tax=Pseudarthrobacter psychrotolerans TaxID=2697569 RepID=A0A6P1NFU5_9MICC|nr:M50 family metallopeptidase [Pseudarthrobacter psychrotolerans]QHK19146.1 M50 family peptidase [Pseudarthrobacter psychrotolerans]